MGMANGALIYFSCGNILRLGEDFKRAQPTIIATVPRILNKYYDSFNKAIDSKPENIKLAIRNAIKEKEEYYL